MSLPVNRAKITKSQTAALIQDQSCCKAWCLCLQCKQLWSGSTCPLIIDFRATGSLRKYWIQHNRMYTVNTLHTVSPIHGRRLQTV